MTDPFTTASGRWGLIFHGSGQYHPSHSRQEWKQIAKAIRSADLVHAAATLFDPDPVPVRGDDAWCQTAINTYLWLSVAAAHLQDPDDEPRCFADEDLVRAWLDAPWVPPDAAYPTVAQMAGYDVQFEQGRLPDPSSITMLVDTAQDVGVFGIAEHRVSLWRFFGDGTLPPHTFIVTVRPPDGPVISSSLVGADRLLRVGGEPVAVIADVLREVADVANGLLESAGLSSGHAVRSTHDHDHASEPPEPIPPGVQGWPIGMRGRPFPRLTGDQPAPVAPPIEAPPSPARPPRRPRI